MDRRGFFKILSATSAGLAGSCGKTDKLIPLLVAEGEIVPGEEQWHPAACTECAAGCGTLVRIMEGMRTVERAGEQLRERVAAIKKMEGNPLDPVSGGRLCARGHAAVQSLYHPDRLRGPMQRTGDRGKGQFAPTSWEQAIAAVADKITTADPARIVFLAGPHVGTRSVAIARFVEALGAPAPVVCSLADCAVERKAAELGFGWKGVPVYDLAHARHVLGVGADFLGGWASPVYYSRQFGAFRQGRHEVRGYLVQAESRLSITAAAADRWLPLRPGSEPQFLAAVGRILLDGGLARNRTMVPPFASADVAALRPPAVWRNGASAKRFRHSANRTRLWCWPALRFRRAIRSTPCSLSHYLNFMLGNMGKPGGVLPPAAAAAAPFENGRVAEALARAQVVLIDGANPAYTLPPSSGVLQALARAETVISFAGFLDDTAAWSDLVLPGHHTLEAELALVPAVSPQPAVTVAMPFVKPLYDTRAVETTLADLARKMSKDYRAITAKDLLPPDAAFEEVARQGGLWGEALMPEPPAPVGQAPSCHPAARTGIFRRRSRPIPAALPALPLAAISRWRRRQPAMASGTARSGIERYLGIAG